MKNLYQYLTNAMTLAQLRGAREVCGMVVKNGSHTAETKRYKKEIKSVVVGDWLVA